MNRVLFVLAIVLAANVFIAAQEAEEADGIGLTANLELGFGDVAAETAVSLMPGVVYEKSFGALDVYGELDYTIAFGDPVAHEMYLEEELGYNIQLAEPSVLSLIVNNNNTFFLSPVLEEGETHEGCVEPSVKYTHTLGFGDMFGQIGFPIDYLTGAADETVAGLYARLGWDSTFGLGLEFTAYTVFHPEREFFGYGLLASYEKGMFYGEVEFKAGREFKDFEILPEIDVSLGAWTFTVRMELSKTDGIDDWEIRPFIGAGYSF